MKKGESILPPGDRGGISPERKSSWEQAADLFATALEKPVADRINWVRGLDIDDKLRSEVVSLLEASEKSGDFLTPGDIPVAGLFDPADAATDPNDPETGETR